MLTRRKRILEASKKRFLPLGFAVIFNVTLAGLVCGTFAWYTYATRVGFEELYHGTTVANMGELQIGLVCNIPLTTYNYTKYGLMPNGDNEPMSNGKYIFWSTSDVLTAAAINYVVNINGYATTAIEPTTSGSNDVIEEKGFHLFRKPTVYDNYNVSSTSSHASQSSYVLIPFVFRTSGSSDGESSNGNVYLSDCSLFTSNDAFDNGELHKAVRFYINHRAGSYIVAPSYKEDGSNDVGGILDLDLDGFYDFSKETNKELVYGEYEGQYSYNSTPTPTNGTLSEEEITSFHSNHKSGVYAVNENTLVPKTVSYYGLSRLISREFPIAVPNSSFDGYSYGEFIIYLEGWDSHVVDREQESAFNLNLTFTL